MKRMNLRNAVGAALLVGGPMAATHALADSPRAGYGPGNGMGPGMMDGYGAGWMGGYGGIWLSILLVAVVAGLVGWMIGKNRK